VKSEREREELEREREREREERKKERGEKGASGRKMEKRARERTSERVRERTRIYVLNFQKVKKERGGIQHPLTGCEREEERKRVCVCVYVGVFVTMGMRQGIRFICVAACDHVCFKHLRITCSASPVTVTTFFDQSTHFARFWAHGRCLFLQFSFLLPCLSALTIFP